MLDDLSFKGLKSLELDELVAADYALDASDCYVDHLGIEPRNGYYANIASTLSGTVQGLWRLRPSATFARLIAATGGTISAITDPSTESANDGAIQSVATPFSSTCQVSAVQLGKYLYLGTDDSTQNWKRARQNGSTVSLDDIAILPKPGSLGTSAGSLTYTTFGTAASFTAGSGATITNDSPSPWVRISGAPGATALFDFGSNLNWNASRWLFVACSPETGSGGGGKFIVEVAAQVAGVPGTFETLDTVYDTPGDDSPYACYFSLLGLTSATRSAVRYIRFRQLGPTSDPFDVAGYMVSASAPSSGEVDYQVTFYNSTTGAESDPSDTLAVYYNSANISIPTFQAATWSGNSFVNKGIVSADPDSLSAGALWNTGAGKQKPSRNDLGAIYSITGSIVGLSGFDKIRLYRQTGTGFRLVREIGTSQAPYSNGSTYSIPDDQGNDVLSNSIYHPGGLPPACVALTAKGGRLIAGGGPSAPNRLFVSSYVAINTTLEGTTTDPFPQWPKVPITETDGWSFDVSPTAAEQILWLGTGDGVYILTNESVYSLLDTTARIDGSDPPFYRLFDRGVVGRRAALYAEQSLFYIAHDGIYECRNSSEINELSGPIRRLFLSWFAPDSTCVLGYQDRKLYAICGTRCLRFDFVTHTWTRHNLSHTMKHVAVWREPGLPFQRLTYLTSSGLVCRWNTAATTDAGTTIPAWTYSTGFDFKLGFKPGEGYGQTKVRVTFIYLDSTGAITCTVYRDTGTSHGRGKTFSTSGEHELAFASDLTGYKFRVALTASNAVTLKRAMWDRETVSSRGAGAG